jgi:hypothetical protein
MSRFQKREFVVSVENSTFEGPKIMARQAAQQGDGF